MCCSCVLKFSRTSTIDIGLIRYVWRLCALSVMGFRSIWGPSWGLMTRQEADGGGL